MRGTAEERFWAKVDKSGDCWVWTAAKDPQGYGHFNVEQRTVLASRWSYEYTHGSIPDSLLVLHKCDNPPCVKPEHLFLGTQQDNTDDMIAKGRQYQRPPRPPKPSTELCDVDPVEWRRQVLENIAKEKAKAKVPVRKTRISKWPDGTYQLTVWYSNGTVVKSGPFDKRSQAMKARRAAY